MRAPSLISKHLAATRWLLQTEKRFEDLKVLTEVLWKTKIRRQLESTPSSKNF